MKKIKPNPIGFTVGDSESLPQNKTTMNTVVGVLIALMVGVIIACSVMVSVFTSEKVTELKIEIEKVRTESNNEILELTAQLNELTDKHNEVVSVLRQALKI